MAWTFVKGKQDTSQSGASTSLALSFASAVVSGDVVCGFVFMNGATSNVISSIQDDKGNNYTVVNAIAATGGSNWETVAFWSGGALTNGPTTITITTSSSVPSGIWGTVDEFTPPAGTLSTDGSSTGLNGGASNPSPGSITTTVNGDLVYSGCFTTSGAAPTAGTGYTITENATDFASEFLSQTTAGATTASFVSGFGQWTANAFAIKAVVSAVIETNTYIQSRQFPLQWNLNSALFRTTAQDFSSFGVETNPHWRGRTWPLLWNVKRDWMPPQDTSSFGVETNPHWAGRQWPVQWNLTLKLRQTDPQDASSFGVETNPHWIGRMQPTVWTPMPLTRAVPTDVSVVQPDTPAYFMPRMQVPPWNLNRSLGRTTANDLSSLGVETNVYFKPSTWPLQWNLQASLMRGAAQDFSSVAPPAQFQYLMNVGGMNIGLNNPSNANSLG